MSMDARNVKRGTLAAATFTVLAGIGWLVTTDSGTETVLFPAEAGVDAAIDAPGIDSSIDAPDASYPTEWTMVTIASNATTGLVGSDGVDTTTIGGNLAVTSAWEQSGVVTVSVKSGSGVGTWSTTQLATVVSVEDAIFCDVDQDGAVDVVGSGQGKRIRIWFGPSPWSTSIEIDAATNLQQWLKLGCSQNAEVDHTARIWAGGRDTVATAYVGYFTHAGSPRTASNYTFHQVAAVDWLMSLLPGDWDGDGDLDVVISDRQNGQGNKGTRLYRAPSWTEVTIHLSNNEGDPKFAYIDDATNTTYVGMSSSTKPNLVKKSVATTSGWSAFTTTTAFTYPSDVGQYQGVVLCELTGDSTDDYVLTHAAATGSLSGVVAVDGVTGERIEIDHAAGEKYDNAICVDIDGDGDNDVLTSEQNTGLGVIYFQNPRLHL